MYSYSYRGSFITTGPNISMPFSWHTSYLGHTRSIIVHALTRDTTNLHTQTGHLKDPPAVSPPVRRSVKAGSRDGRRLAKTKT